MYIRGYAHVFKTEDEYKKWLTDLNYNISKNKKKDCSLNVDPYHSGK